MNSVIEYIKSQHERYISELQEYLSIPCISSDPDHKDDMTSASEFTAELIRKAGCEDATVRQTSGHPVVTGSIITDENLPTVLVYGHYDVQPVDPLELWEKPPFEAHIKNDTIIARGSADDKGQIFMHVKAIEAFKETGNKPPVNIKFLLEGEEEIASPNLPAFLNENKKLLSADVVLVSDTSMWAEGMPSICYALKGLTYLELFLTGPNRDLHSGEFGGAVANPAEILARMIAKAKNEDGQILIPGFYNKVAKVSDFERSQIDEIPFSADNYKDDLEVKELWGEIGFSTVERVWIRPTFEVNGIWGGFIGEGAKTVLPSKAGAKISMRLVPDQDPNEIADLVEDFFRSIAPESISLEIKRHGCGHPVITPMDSPFMEPAKLALERAFGRKPLMIRGGGSIPIVADFKKILGLNTLLVGFSLPGARAHSPNENLHLPSFYTGIESLAYMYRNFNSVEII